MNNNTILKIKVLCFCICEELSEGSCGKECFLYACGEQWSTGHESSNAGNHLLQSSETCLSSLCNRTKWEILVEYALFDKVLKVLVEYAFLEILLCRDIQCLNYEKCSCDDGCSMDISNLDCVFACLI